MQTSPQSTQDSSRGGMALSQSEQQLLLGVARRAIAAAVAGEPQPTVEGGAWPRNLQLPRACFVTLRCGNELRGCIGQLVASEPLWQAVLKNAARAARNDYRFTPVTPEEVGSLRVEISVLTPPVPLSFGSPEELLAQLRPGIDGVVLRIGQSLSTFLPQVWDELADKETFMNHLSRKGGHEPGAWRQAGPGVSVYEVEHFAEA